MSEPRFQTGVALSVPANLLLLGEYAVLEEGGLGLALAIDRRARGACTPGAGVPADGDVPRVTGLVPGGRITWPGEAGVLGKVCEYLLERIGSVAGEMEVDTSEFFAADGRKLGFGSSAAMSVVVTSLWLAAREGERPAPDDVIGLAVAAHREAQGGRGSGYDVATSATGGIVVFTGGRLPSARRVELPWLPEVAVFAGERAVVTTGAVGRYEQWKSDRPDEADRFRRRSNELVRRIVEVSTWQEALPLLAEYRDLAVGLGEDIGVPATLAPADDGSDSTFRKAVGAGNELGVALGRGGGEPAPVAAEGIRWE